MRIRRACPDGSTRVKRDEPPPVAGCNKPAPHARSKPPGWCETTKAEQDRPLAADGRSAREANPRGGVERAREWTSGRGVTSTGREEEADEPQERRGVNPRLGARASKERSSAGGQSGRYIRASIALRARECLEGPPGDGQRPWRKRRRPTIRYRNSQRSGPARDRRDLEEQIDFTEAAGGVSRPTRNDA